MTRRLETVIPKRLVLARGICCHFRASQADSRSLTSFWDDSKENNQDDGINKARQQYEKKRVLQA